MCKILSVLSAAVHVGYLALGLTAKNAQTKVKQTHQSSFNRLQT